MLRRTFLRCLAALPFAGLVRPRPADAAPSPAVIGVDIAGGVDRSAVVVLHRHPDGGWVVVGTGDISGDQAEIAELALRELR